MMIIERPLEMEALRAGGWTFVYGRRKTGKTFLVENFVDYDAFFFVKRDGSILDKETWEEIGYDALKAILRTYIKDGKTVVIDEFHRLGADFMDLLHALPVNGILIIISSTLHTSKQLLGSSSPILGKFSEIRIPLINLGDALRSIHMEDAKRKGEIALMMREPMLIEHVQDGIERAVGKFSMAAQSLIGEVFSEEERRMSRTYEGVIRAIAYGKRSSGEISSFLYSRRLIPRNDPSLIQQYLNNLVSFGILEKVPVWGRKRFVYQHSSPFTELYFYLDEKYAISERNIGIGEIRGLVDSILPRIMERNIRDFLAFILGMRAYVHQSPDFEVDGILSRFKRPDIAIEVKWKSEIRKRDVIRAEENLKRIPAERRILIVPDKTDISSSLEVMDLKDLLKMYEEKIGG